MAFWGVKIAITNVLGQHYVYFNLCYYILNTFQYVGYLTVYLVLILLISIEF